MTALPLFDDSYATELVTRRLRALAAPPARSTFHQDLDRVLAAQRALVTAELAPGACPELQLAEAESLLHDRLADFLGEYEPRPRRTRPKEKKHG